MSVFNLGLGKGGREGGGPREKNFFTSRQDGWG